MLFNGRRMVCKNCGFTMTSSKEFESMWTTVQVDDKLIDFCPKCWGVPRRHWPPETVEAYDQWIQKGSKKGSDNSNG